MMTYFSTIWPGCHWASKAHYASVPHLALRASLGVNLLYCIINLKFLAASLMSRTERTLHRCFGLETITSMFQGGGR